MSEAAAPVATVAILRGKRDYGGIIVLTADKL
jgi:hypothetical protein